MRDSATAWRQLRQSAPALLALAAGCAPAGPPAAGPAATPALAWGGAPATPIAYVVADTGAFVMDIPGMGQAPVDIRSEIAAELTFTAAPAGVRVTARVTGVSGTFSSPAAAPVTAGAADVPGPAALEVAANGAMTLADTPAFTSALAQVMSPQSLYRSFFVRLPGRVVARGATWTDTVRVAEEQSGMRSQLTQVIRSTWSRDTALAGRTLAVITSAIATTIELSGSSQGVDIRQFLSGESSAVTLFDAPRGVLVERREEGTARGTAELPAFQMENIPVTARSLQVVRLVQR